MKDLGEAKKILGMEIKWDRRKDTIWLTQSQYLRRILQRFGMDGSAKPVSTPLASHFKLNDCMSPTMDGVTLEQVRPIDPFGKISTPLSLI